MAGIANRESDPPADDRGARISAWRWLGIGIVGAGVSILVGLALIFADGPRESPMFGIIPGAYTAGLIMGARTVRHWVGAATATSFVYFAIGIAVFIPVWFSHP